MILQNLAHKKGKEVVGHNIQSWTKRRRRNGFVEDHGLRHFFTNERSKTQLREDQAKEHVKQLSDKQKAKKAARAIDKDFFLSVLHSSATKREAKSYLQNFTPSKTKTKTPEPLSESVSSPQEKHKQYARGVNLGGLYGPAAIQGSPKFVQEPQTQRKTVNRSQLHVAMVKIRAPQTLKDETLNGIGKTLSQLSRLGLVSVVVLDCADTNESNSSKTGIDPTWRRREAEQANRILAAIEISGNTTSRIVDNIIGVVERPEKPVDSSTMETRITLRKLLMTPLSKGVIAVVPTIGYTNITQTAVRVPASSVILALTRELAGLPAEISPDEDPIAVQKRLKIYQREVSLDRLIIIDPLGGIPSKDRLNGYHVFLNMEQEFEPTKQDLERSLGLNGVPQNLQDEDRVSDLASSSPMSKFAEIEFGNTRKSSQPKVEAKGTTIPNWYHLQNLQLARSVLSMLPPSSSALLTSPEEAANSGKGSLYQPAGVGTRRQRNPLIHNLLTDRPVFSSSLPVGRLGGQSMARGPVALTQTITPTTFAKHGMSVTIFPDPRLGAWEPPAPGKPQFSLTDAQIDLPRLVHLIEDSFGRKLDVEGYLKRVNQRIAGVVIAGEYEGGALLTWETPPGVLDDGSPANRARMVPYLDKFAVLKKRQGSATADLVFKAMVRDCFPQGVCWRSRKDNVVNKWYFERSRGTWKLPDTGWTMFWTTPDLSMERQTFLDYEGVCRGIEPSWADNKSILD